MNKTQQNLIKYWYQSTSSTRLQIQLSTLFAVFSSGLLLVLVFPLLAEGENIEDLILL